MLGGGWGGFPDTAPLALASASAASEASPGSVTAPLSARRAHFQEERQASLRQTGPQQASTADGRRGPGSRAVLGSRVGMSV